MLSNRILAVSLAAGAILLASSCSDDFTQPTLPTDQLDPAGVAVQQGQPDDPVALARGVPGFGGFFVDEQGTPTIYLKDTGQRGAAERALLPLFRLAEPAAAVGKASPLSWNRPVAGS